ncbi:MAG: hypothetical protein P1P65_06555 [Treponema sp.]
MKIHKLLSYVCCCILTCVLASCMTVPKESDIPDSATPADLTQKAQEAFDANNYRAAYAYYHIILKRFSSDEAVCVAAEYEIAHLHVKKRKWKEAQPLLEKIIAQYEGPSGIQLPPAYYKLAKIDYTRVTEKLGSKTKKNK